MIGLFKKTIKNPIVKNCVVPTLLLGAHGLGDTFLSILRKGSLKTSRGLFERERERTPCCQRRVLWCCFIFEPNWSTFICNPEIDITRLNRSRFKTNRRLFDLVRLGDDSDVDIVDGVDCGSCFI